jgi:hypothetical protein
MLNSTIIKQHFDIKNEIDNHVTTFLDLLQNKELDILNEHTPDLILYRHDFCHYYFRVNFLDNYEYTKDNKFGLKKNPLKYIFKSYATDCIFVELCCNTLAIPYTYNREYLDGYYSSYFEILNADIQKILVRINKCKQEHTKSKQLRQSIKSEHKFGEYTYWWTDCPACFRDYLGYSDGERLIHTGKYEDSRYHEGTDEIIESGTCLTCHGDAGLLQYYKGKFGTTQSKPCHHWHMEQYEHDFMSLIT